MKTHLMLVAAAALASGFASADRTDPKIAPDPVFQSPLKKPFKIVRSFRTGPGTSVVKDTYYPGLGFQTVPGAFVYAARGGRVTRAIKSTFEQMKIEIDHGDGWSSVYYYMDTAYVGLGDPVAAGAVIGVVRGDKTRPVIEFDTLRNGMPVNPAGHLDFSRS